MRGNIGDKTAPTAHMLDLSRYEPWKVMATVTSLAAVVFGTLGAVFGYMLGGMH